MRLQNPTFKKIRFIFCSQRSTRSGHLQIEQIVSQLQIIAYHRLRFILNQTAPQQRQMPFLMSREVAVQVVGNEELKNRVAKEFETLIVASKTGKIKIRVKGRTHCVRLL
jgi:hypothetical protein